MVSVRALVEPSRLPSTHHASESVGLQLDAALQQLIDLWPSILEELRGTLLTMAPAVAK